MTNTAPEPVSAPALKALALQRDLPAIADVLSRSFLATHLLTGNAIHAEMAVIHAIDSWNPGEEDEGVLFHRSLRAAAAMMSHNSSSQAQNGAADSYLPNELREFLTLPSVLRGPIVLRSLAGVSAEVCGEMLQVDDLELPEFSDAAFRDSTEGLSARRSTE